STSRSPRRSTSSSSSSAKAATSPPHSACGRWSSSGSRSLPPAGCWAGGSGRCSACDLPDQRFEAGVRCGTQLGGPRVVLASVFLARRLLRGEDHSEVEVRIRVVRVERRGGLEFLLRGVRPALLAGGDPQVIVGGRVLGIQRE